VLALAAAEGLVGFGLTWDEKISKLEPYLLCVSLGVAVVSPAVAVLAMFAHGRLLLWAGRMLGGKARPVEIHAAVAWSQLPLVLVGWPGVLRIATRAAVVEHDPVPIWLQFLDDLLLWIVGWSHWPTVVAGLLGAVLFVGYLAEAQGFTSRRAFVNVVLASVVGIVVLGAGIGLGWALKFA
jgi:hypothetical protein